MSETTIVKPDQRTRDAYYEILGIARALERCGGDTPLSTLPGFAYAHALVSAEMAEARTSLAHATFKCIARAGLNAGEFAKVGTIVKDGEILIELTPPDLLDLAESAS